MKASFRLSVAESDSEKFWNDILENSRAFINWSIYVTKVNPKVDKGCRAVPLPVLFSILLPVLNKGESLLNLIPRLTIIQWAFFP
nr:hypothetical protein MACL_00003302 [Theileria orientalis]